MIASKLANLTLIVPVCEWNGHWEDMESATSEDFERESKTDFLKIRLYLHVFSDVLILAVLYDKCTVLYRLFGTLHMWLVSVSSSEEVLKAAIHHTSVTMYKLNYLSDVLWCQ